MKRSILNKAFFILLLKMSNLFWHFCVQINKFFFIRFVKETAILALSKIALRYHPIWSNALYTFGTFSNSKSSAITLILLKFSNLITSETKYPSKIPCKMNIIIYQGQEIHDIFSNIQNKLIDSQNVYFFNYAHENHQWKPPSII